MQCFVIIKINRKAINSATTVENSFPVLPIIIHIPCDQVISFLCTHPREIEPCPQNINVHSSIIQYYVNIIY